MKQRCVSDTIFRKTSGILNGFLVCYSRIGPKTLILGSESPASFQNRTTNDEACWILGSESSASFQNRTEVSGSRPESCFLPQSYVSDSCLRVLHLKNSNARNTMWHRSRHSDCLRHLPTSVAVQLACSRLRGAQP